MKRKNKRNPIPQIRSSWNWALIFLAILLPQFQNPRFVKNLESTVEIAPQIHSPANIFAVRLKGTKPNLSLCTQGACYRLSTHWTLVPAPMNYIGNVGLLFTEDSKYWSFGEYEVSGIFFDRSQKNLTQLRLPAQVIKEVAQTDPGIEAKRAQYRELYNLNSNRPWSTHWRMPIVSVVTSNFGSPRIPPNGAPYSHTGLDLRAATGTEVRACSDGIVLDRSWDPMSGNSVTLDHGHGLLSRYLHLSAFKTNIGEEVKAGELIGISGTTGRSEAPHLHWEMRLYGKPIDPLATMHLMEHLADLE